MKKLLLAITFALMASVALRAQTVVDIIVNSPDHSILEQAVITAGLATDLATIQAATVFAPDDDAFNALPPGTIPALLADSAGLRNILLYHVVGAEIPSSAIPAGQVFVNSLRNDLSIQVVRDTAITLNQNAVVNAADLDATNGVVHSISAVILPQTITEFVVNSTAHTTLETAVVAAGYANALNTPGAGPFTLFAPTDDAFGTLPAGALDSIVNDAAALDETILYHLIGGAARSNIVNGLFFNPTVNNGYALQLQGDGAGTVTANNIPVSTTDIVAINGVIHVLDGVLSPPTIADFVGISVLHETLEVAVGAAGNGVAAALDDRSSQLTLFAPTDAGFDALPMGTVDTLVNNPDDLADVLLYHALADTVFADQIATGLSFAPSIATYSLQLISDADGISVDNNDIIAADILTTNGVIHVPGGVLLPPSVVDIAVRSPVHNTLVGAVTDANLVTTLADPDGTFTVFAPTDDAFAAVDTATLNSLLRDPAGRLTSVLTYHVLGQEVSASDIIDNNITTAPTVQGEDIEIAVSNGVVTLDGSIDVIIADIQGTNGIVHVIDGVLIPENITSSTTGSASEAGIVVAPIPANDYTTVTLPNSILEEVQLDIYDVRGAMLRSDRLNGSQTQVDLSTLSAGTYYFMFRSGANQYRQTVIVR